MRLSLRGAARAIGLLSPSLLSRLKANGRLADYVVVGAGPNGQDLIELEPLGRLPLADYVASFRRAGGGGEDDDQDGLESLEDSRRIRQHYQAKAAQLEAEALAAKLVRADVVAAILDRALPQVHERASAIGPRILASLGAALGPLTLEQQAGVLQLLEPAVANALQVLEGITFAGAEPLEDEGELVPV